ncbi:hypothetical protein ACFQAS_13185 [Halopenitus salinus]|uniref:Nif11 domain-containing protein n=1 Tax=Halopenitus salinus TaxID=1198295 RepID=A0ABD5UVK2_9EURY
MDEDEFKKRLRKEFNCTSKEREKVVREAKKLEGSGLYELFSEEDDPFTIDAAISSMKAAPGHLKVTGKWNYWMGLLGTGDAGFDDFKS